MNKTITQIREITKIEKELTLSAAGVLAIRTSGDEVLQIPCTFLYYHKNIYANVPLDDDILEKITYDSNVSFSVINSENLKRRKKQEEHTVRIFSITLSGSLKRPEEFKIPEIIKEEYNIKYSGRNDGNEETEKLLFLMLDTSEIKAVEEIIK